MSDDSGLAALVLLSGAVVIVAVLSNRLTERLRVPAPVLMLAAAAVVAQVWPGLRAAPAGLAQGLVTVALVLILFEGGMGIGWPAFREAARSITLVGVVGTFLTAAGVAAFAHLVLGLDWYPAVLLATAVAPTDPAVVFSVLGARKVSGRSGTILEGESGANDPVGIALMTSLLAAGGFSGDALAEAGGSFALQMVVGATAGLVGGRVLLWCMRHVPLPASGLYPLSTLAAAFCLYGLTTLLYGSGFLAVFVAGILIGEARAPYKREIEHFHSALASLGEIVAFVVLGLTVDLAVLSDPGVWVPGLAVAVALASVVRPLALEPLLAGSGLARREKSFVMFAGLKGAVPILLGTFIVTEGIRDFERLYGIVVVVVVASVAVQGSLVPTAARVLGIPMRVVEPEPWSLGVRLREEPNGVHRLSVAPGAPADGVRIGDLDGLPESAWISFVVRRGQLVRVSATTVLQHGDEALLLGAPEDTALLRGLFEGRGTP